MTKKNITRRKFLRFFGDTAAGATMLAAGLPLLTLPGNAWALELKHLSEHEGRTLLKAARLIYPHDTLSDVYYAGVVEALDGDAAADSAKAKVIRDAVAKLDATTQVKWLELSDGYQLRTLLDKAADLHAMVRGKSVVALYNNPLVWRHFGYEGPSAQHGGYIHRGFDDLTWLPAPDAAASPPAES